MTGPVVTGSGVTGSGVNGSGVGVMFPGQGTQRLGMGRWLERASPAASSVFDLAAEVLDRDVRALCFTGPARELTLTQHAQVAVFTVNAAALAYLHEQGHDPVLALGHSVGELNALCAAGILSLADGFALVAERGRLMGEITASGAMSATIGLPASRVRELCEDATRPGSVVVPALLNGSANVVVSGDTEAIERFEPLARDAGAHKVTRLVVSSAFHSPLMDVAVAAWRPTVAALDLRPPSIPVLLNTTGTFAVDEQDVATALVDQITGPVRWVEEVHAAAAHGVDPLVECGDSKVLTALARSIEPGLTTLSLSDPRALRRHPWPAPNTCTDTPGREVAAGAGRMMESDS